MSTLAEKLAGRFIVFDGPDGSGKSTQLALLSQHLTERGCRVERVHDPGTTAVGEKIRAILLDRDIGAIAPMCEALLFMASRAQLIEERIRPALAAGKVVLCDRFISATVAYQGASGVDPNKIIEVGDVAVQGVWPDLTIILDLPAEVGLERLGRRQQRGGDAGDRMERRGLPYHQAVLENFRRLAEVYPRPVAFVPGAGDADAVFQDVLAELEKAFPDDSG
jgi:dTMP kinase